MKSTKGAAYDILARDLRGRILQGEFGDSGQLPTEAELAKLHQLSRQTVRRAFQELVYEGVITRIPGRGTFVSGGGSKRYLRQFGSIEDLMSLSVDSDLVVREPLQRRIEVAASSRLQLDSDVVFSVKFDRVHQDEIFCITTVYVPPDIGNLLEQKGELSEVGSTRSITVIGLIDAEAEHPIAEAAQSITAVSADDAMAEILSVKPTQPLLRIDRLYFDTHARPVELAISYFAPQHYSYRVRLRRTRR
jgi:GntR family transcriptional regulator